MKVRTILVSVVLIYIALVLTIAQSDPIMMLGGGLLIVRKLWTAGWVR